MSTTNTTTYQPAGTVVSNQTTSTTTTTTAPTHHYYHQVTQPVTTTTTLTPQPTVNDAIGKPLVSDIGGPLGGSVILGGQCECTRDGGQCSHGAGQCQCRGCTAAMTSVNPGVNVGMSTVQYTAPVGTTGLGGGVAEAGTGIPGVVNPTNTVGVPVSTTVQNCECVKSAGVCNCTPGECGCVNCKAGRMSRQAAMASRPLGGSEYLKTNAENYTSATTTKTDMGGMRTVTNEEVITDNSNVPYRV